MINNYKLKFFFLLIIINKSFKLKTGNDFTNKLFRKQITLPISYSINDLVIKSIDIHNNSILILEPFHYHYECTPGFIKYFIDLGYDVDIIMHKMGITSLTIFEPIFKVRLFIYEDNEILNEKAANLSSIFQKYNFILIETTEPKMFDLYTKLNLLNCKNSIFVFHHIDYSYSFPFISKLKNCQKWSLGNFSNITYVNPNYFGYIKKKRMNRIKEFFITSTKNRTYNLLISAAEEIKKENLKFHITVVGKVETFSRTNISESLKDNFSFKYKISYINLYKHVFNSDFIIINFDPNNSEDMKFQKIRVTGSSQLSYGFLKPVIINEKFASFYNFNYSNSLVYENSNFSKVLNYAININNKEYKKLQNNLLLLSKEIYSNSLNNVKNSLKEIIK